MFDVRTKHTDQHKFGLSSNISVGKGPGALSANYFVQFAQQYKDIGIDIWAMSVQNEPMHGAAYPTTVMSAEQQEGSRFPCWNEPPAVLCHLFVWIIWT